MKKCYIETSIVSYLTAKPSDNLIAAARQNETICWWDTRRSYFEICVSGVVLEEASRGDPSAATRRMNALKGIPVLPLDQNAADLAESLIKEGGMPQKAMDDALHIAIAATNQVHFLLTWNCRHIDNAEMKPKIRGIIESAGFSSPEIATPSELMGVENYG